MGKKKKNIPLIVALSIPVCMIVLIAVSIYLPAVFVKPTMDFIYRKGENYYWEGKRCCRNSYSNRNGRIVKNTTQPPENSPCLECVDHFFYYDVRQNRSREIPFDEAAKFILDGSSVSPDGFEVVSGGDGFDIFFLRGSSRYDQYLKKGAYNQKLNLIGPSTRYYDFRFIGWVKGETDE